MKECLIFFTSALVLMLIVYKTSMREDYYLADYDKIPSCECSKLFLNRTDI